MVKAKEKRGLGRGLSALMADASLTEATTPSRLENSNSKYDFLIPIELIQPNADQPRQNFDVESLNELSASIREKGIIQPLIVREMAGDEKTYQIVAGERRWRAAQAAKLHEVPVVVRNFDDKEVLEIAIIENIQRADLNPIEEALGYRQLMDRHDHTQEKLAEALGKSRSYIANILRLLSLPDDIQNLVRTGKLSAGHARALITSNEPEKLADLAVKNNLSVREIEKLAKTNISKSTQRPKTEKDADTIALENDLIANLRLPVSIEHKETGNGKLTIVYKSLEELDGLCALLTSGLR